MLLWYIYVYVEVLDVINNVFFQHFTILHSTKFNYLVF